MSDGGQAAARLAAWGRESRALPYEAFHLASWLRKRLDAGVIITQARHAARAAGLNDDSVDMNVALLEALDNPKSLRRWRDGKKAFVG